MTGDEHSRAATRALLDWKVLVPFWVLLSVAITVPELVAYWGNPAQHPIGRAWAGNLVCCLLWAAVSPLILILSRVFFLGGRWWIPRLLLHVVASAVCTTLVLFLFALVAPVLFRESVGDRTVLQVLASLMSTRFTTMVPYYWLVLLAHHLLTYVDRSRQGQLTASQVKGQLARARLEVLRSRLHPHFLFNTLHTIGSLIRLDRRKLALETLEEFGHLLRQALDQSEQQYIPLSEELGFIAKYLNIECRRFPDRLRVTYEIDPETRNVEVPALILQPLVENAVRHGVGGSRNGGSVGVAARRDQKLLRLEVTDDGPGLRNGGPDGPAAGVGLRTTRDRLQQLYPGTHRFELSNRQPSGVVATVWIPWRTMT